MLVPTAVFVRVSKLPDVVAMALPLMAVPVVNAVTTPAVIVAVVAASVARAFVPSLIDHCAVCVPVPALVVVNVQASSSAPSAGTTDDRTDVPSPVGDVKEVMLPTPPVMESTTNPASVTYVFFLWIVVPSAIMSPILDRVCDRKWLLYSLGFVMPFHLQDMRYIDHLHMAYFYTSMKFNTVSKLPCPDTEIFIFSRLV